MIVKKEKKLSTWIYTSIVILINAFIIVISSLPNSVSRSFSGFFANIVKSIFNIAGNDTTEIIEVSNLYLSYDDTYEYNAVDGYKDNEIVIGKSKRLKTELSPSNASNTAIKYSVSDQSIASVKQDSNFAYVNGLSSGKVTITAISESNNTVYKSYEFNVVNKKAPTYYTICDIDVYEGQLFHLPFSIDEKYRDYYDIKQLNISNSDVSVANLSSYDGFYKALTVGRTMFSIEGKEAFKVNVKDKSSAILPTFSSITGKDSVYNNASTWYGIEINNEPSSKDVVWTINHNEYASISYDGLLSVKDVYEEQEVVITASSILDTSISMSKTIKLLPNVITGFNIAADTYGDITNKTIEAETGQQIKINVNNKIVNNKGVTVAFSNDELAKAYTQGNVVLVECLKEGDIRLTLNSVEAPTISQYVDIKIETRGIINRDNYASFSVIVRKSLGHFLLFTLDGIFSLLLFSSINESINYKRKKWWHYLVIVSFFGLFMAFFSEFIQLFIQYRDFAFLDVGIDILGYTIGSGVTLLIRYIKRKYNKKKTVEFPDS